MLWLAGFSAFAAVLLGAYGLWLARGGRAGALARSLGEVPLDRGAVAGVGRGLFRWLQKRVSGFLPGYALDDIRERLVWAGKPYGLDAEEFYTVKLLSALAVGVLVPLALRPGALMALVLTVSAVAGGYALPELWLGRLAGARREQMRSQAPSFADLLAVACEAGLDLLSAVEEVARHTPGLLGREFMRARAEIMAGRPREEAWADLGARSGCDEVSALAGAIAQAERYGTPVAEVLRAQAHSLRDAARNRLQERAQGLTVKIIFPVLLFFFVPLGVILMGPIFVSMLRVFRP